MAVVQIMYFVSKQKRSKGLIDNIRLQSSTNVTGKLAGIINN